LDAKTQVDFQWQQQFEQPIIEIVRRNIASLVTIAIASPQEDMREAADMVIRVKAGTVGVRVRRNAYVNRYRDWTIRYSRPSKALTEWHKLRNGFTDWYFYGWQAQDGNLGDWMLIDMKTVRATGLFDRAWPIHPNGDGSSTFIAIPADVLVDSGCLIDYRLSFTRTGDTL
jgi:hypothetical protein